MQRPWMCGATAAGETKQRVTQQSPRRQTAMMARHFTTGHCADASIPALGLDASTLAAPFNTASSTPSAPHSLPLVLLPPKTSNPSHGSLWFFRRRRIFELMGEVPWAPPGQQEQAKSPRLWAPGAGGPLCIEAPTQGAENSVAPRTSMALTLWGPAPGGALNTPWPWWRRCWLPAPRGASTGRFGAEAALVPLPPVADALVPQEVAPFMTEVVATWLWDPSMRRSPIS
jgi:hypothetical protein